MSRRPNVECAGGCGKLLYGGRGSLPPGVRCCKACRAEGRAPVPAKTAGRRPLGEPRVCDQPTCGAKHFALGLCNRHYKRRRREQGLDQSKQRPIVHVMGMASLHGALFPKPKPIKGRVTIGFMASCPWCDTWMGCTGEAARFCRHCGTTVQLNPEELAWVISEAHSTAA